MASKAKTTTAPKKAASAKKTAAPKKVTKASSKAASPRAAAAAKRAVKKAAPKEAATRKTVAKSVSTAAKKTAPKAASAKRAGTRKTNRKTPAAAASTRKTLNGNGTNRRIISEMETMMKQGPIQFDQLAREAGDAGREGVDAFMKSGAIFAKGYEDIIRTATSLAQESAEKQAQYFKDAMSSKTLNEWAEVQNKIAQAGFDDFMEGATKLSEISAKILSEVSEPLNAQMGKAMKKASTAAA